MRFENTELFRHASRFAQGSRNDGRLDMLTRLEVRENVLRCSNQLTVVTGVFDL